MKLPSPVSEAAKAATVGDAWAVVHSFETGQFYPEELVDAVQKNYRSFIAAAGEDWQIVGIFSSYGEAHSAIIAWVRTPGAKRAREGAIL